VLTARGDLQVAEQGTRPNLTDDVPPLNDLSGFLRMRARCRRSLGGKREHHHGAHPSALHAVSSGGDGFRAAQTIARQP
jgi:hypothetical protein